MTARDGSSDTVIHIEGLHKAVVDDNLEQCKAVHTYVQGHIDIRKLEVKDGEPFPEVCEKFRRVSSLKVKRHRPREV